MSDTISACEPAPVSLEELEIWRVGFYQTAASFVLWGLQISLVSQAVYIIWKRGSLRNSRSHQCMTAIVLTMLAASTALVMISFEVYLVQLPYIGIANAPEVERQLVFYETGRTWLIRLNYCLSDIVVVWRAWALWPDSRPIRWVLAGSVGITLVCTIVNATLSTVENLQFTPDPEYFGPMYPPSALRALLYIPLVSTNLVATALICYKAWCYRRDIRIFTTEPKAFPTRLSRVFALFIETGALYVMFFILNMLCSFGVFENLELGYTLAGLYSIIMNAITVIYPTVIIILVSTFMSQSDVVLTSGQHISSSGTKSPNPKPGPALNENGTHMLSTIRFDLPRMQTTSSSSEGYNGERRQDESV